MKQFLVSKLFFVIFFTFVLCLTVNCVEENDKPKGPKVTDIVI